MALRDLFPVRGVFELQEGQVEFFHRVEPPKPEQVLLQGPNEPPRVPVEDFEAREQARTEYENALRQRYDAEKDDYDLLKNLRNQVAHGNRGITGEVQKVLLNESKMHTTLDQLLKQIEDKKLPRAPQA